MGKNNRRVTARTPNQKELIQTVNENDITIIDGLWGTGKSYLATGLAFEYYDREKVDRIVFARTTKNIVKEYGFSPGTYDFKSRAMFEQQEEYCKEFFGAKEFDKLWEQGVIQFTSTSIMRGRSFENTFIIADEMQECNKDDWILMISRLDKNSKFLAIGDRSQNGGDSCFFAKVFDKLESSGVGKARLGPEDIQRNKHIYEVCTKISEIY